MGIDTQERRVERKKGVLFGLTRRDEDKNQFQSGIETEKEIKNGIDDFN